MVPVNVTMNLAAENDTNLLSHASEGQKSGALLLALTVRCGQDLWSVVYEESPFPCPSSVASRRDIALWVCPVSSKPGM